MVRHTSAMGGCGWKTSDDKRLAWHHPHVRRLLDLIISLTHMYSSIQCT